MDKQNNTLKRKSEREFIDLYKDKNKPIIRNKNIDHSNKNLTITKNNINTIPQNNIGK